jgi:hypothetical protein
MFRRKTEITVHLVRRGTKTRRTEFKKTEAKRHVYRFQQNMDDYIEVEIKT